jgi:hypothetical protein
MQRDKFFNADVVSFCGKPLHVVLTVLDAIKWVDNCIFFVVGAVYKGGHKFDAIMLFQLSGVDYGVDSIQGRAAYNSRPSEPQLVFYMDKGGIGAQTRSLV